MRTIVFTVRELQSCWLTFMLLLFCVEKGGATISGPGVITPGSNNAYSWSVNGGSSPSWNATGLVSLTPQGASAILNVSPSALICDVVLTVSYIDQNSQQQSETLTVTVAPFIAQVPGLIPIGTPTIFPGQSITLNIIDQCQTRSGCQYNWGINDPSACTGCGLSVPQNNITVSCPLSLNPVLNSIGQYQVNAGKSCLSPVQAAFNMAQVNIPIRLQDPTVTGSPFMGCFGTPTEVEFNASLVPGAAYWVWNFPTSLFTMVAGSLNSPQIRLTATGVGNGSITVQAFSQSGSVICSNVVTYPVQVCCTSNVIVSGLVAPGYIEDRQIGMNLEAGNTISNGAIARYHAGNQVQLSPGFTAETGSQFHAYIEYCSGNFVDRPSQPLGASTATEQGTTPPVSGVSVQQTLASFETQVYPNPGSGHFVCAFGTSEERTIEVTDVLGNVYLTKKTAGPKETVDITTANSGLYFFRISHASGQIEIKKVIHD